MKTKIEMEIKKEDNHDGGENEEEEEEDKEVKALLMNPFHLSFSRC